jgi:hypothetical protein
MSDSGSQIKSAQFGRARHGQTDRQDIPPDRRVTHDRGLAAPATAGVITTGTAQAVDGTRPADGPVLLAQTGLPNSGWAA